MSSFFLSVTQPFCLEATLSSVPPDPPPPPPHPPTPPHPTPPHPPTLQCLAHSWPLMQVFLSGAYRRDMNKDNPVSSCCSSSGDQRRQPRQQQQQR